MYPSIYIYQGTILYRFLLVLNNCKLASKAILFDGVKSKKVGISCLLLKIVVHYLVGPYFPTNEQCRANSLFGICHEMVRLIVFSIRYVYLQGMEGRG